MTICEESLSTVGETNWILQYHVPAFCWMAKVIYSYKLDVIQYDKLWNPEPQDMLSHPRTIKSELQKT